MFNFIRIKSINYLLTKEATASLALSHCVSHLDYCNSVMYGLPEVTLKKLQQVQNMCAHLVLRSAKSGSTTACLAALHWLLIKQHIKFKICVFTYKLLNQKGPMYLYAGSFIQYFGELYEGVLHHKSY